MSDYGQPLSRSSRKQPPLGSHRLARENGIPSAPSEPVVRGAPSLQPVSDEGATNARDGPGGQPLQRANLHGRDSGNVETPITRRQVLSAGRQPLQQELRGSRMSARDAPNRQVPTRDKQQRGQASMPGTAAHLQRRTQQQALVAGRDAGAPVALQRSSMGQAIAKEPQRAQARPPQVPVSWSPPCNIWSNTLGNAMPPLHAGIYPCRSPVAFLRGYL
jgi:hypothetical protein